MSKLPNLISKGHPNAINSSKILSLSSIVFLRKSTHKKVYSYGKVNWKAHRTTLNRFKGYTAWVVTAICQAGARIPT